MQQTNQNAVEEIKKDEKNNNKKQQQKTKKEKLNLISNEQTKMLLKIDRKKERLHPTSNEQTRILLKIESKKERKKERAKGRKKDNGSIIIIVSHTPLDYNALCQSPVMLITE